MMKDQYIKISGIETRYISQGEGPAVLLVHGFGGFLESWEYNMADLSINHTVFAIDLPGHGKTAKVEEGYTLKYAVDFVLDFIKSMGIGPVSLVGHSAGGLICGAIAADHPEMVEKLILVDSAGLNRNIPLAFRIATIPVIKQLVITLSLKTFIKYGTRRAFYNPMVIDQEWVRMSYEYLQNAPAKRTLLNILSANIDIAGLKEEATITSRLKSIQCPTLVIHGVQDRIIPADHLTEIYQLIPQVECEIFDECGHCPHMENYIRFNWLAANFLNKTR
jgi:pimeloyl-ACP methyl ester carboxylesterase